MSLPLDIFLPATEPTETRFGHTPQAPLVPGHDALAIDFGQEVWYTPKRRIETWQKLDSARQTGRPLWLIGFSKSALGALNLTIDHPGVFERLILFDAPLMVPTKPDWVADYEQESWHLDRPLQRLQGLTAALEHTQLIHIGGILFHRQHQQFAELLDKRHIRHHHRHSPRLRHHWDSGWIDTAAAMLG